MFVYGLRNETSGPYFKSNNLKVCTPLFFLRDPTSTIWKITIRIFISIFFLIM